MLGLVLPPVGRICGTGETPRPEARGEALRALTDRTVYLFLSDISRTTREFVWDNKEYIAGYQNLVLDLRGNSGGWIEDFYRIADLFTPEGAVLAYEEVWLPMLSRRVTSRGDRFFYFENIIILQNRRTASAAEGLIEALIYHLPEAVALGETTFGKGTGQVTIPLSGGYALRATVINMLGPGGDSIHETGISPDIPAAPYVDLIKRALAEIRGQR